jgi:DNA-binding transcriptional ArsR family regulator
MSDRARAGFAGTRRAHAAVFAALGDETRLSLVQRLCEESPQSISRLTELSTLTRQGISKHLRVLRDAGLVGSVRVGRESRYELQPEPIEAVRSYLDDVSRHWDEALGRLGSVLI